MLVWIVLFLEMFIILIGVNVKLLIIVLWVYKLKFWKIMVIFWWIFWIGVFGLVMLMLLIMMELLLIFFNWFIYWINVFLLELEGLIMIIFFFCFIFKVIFFKMWCFLKYLFICFKEIIGSFFCNYLVEKIIEDLVRNVLFKLN